ncbi:hypothetical protein GGR57DRAFT_495273 [Xylariaceae sp. FL1272]|nr:hypothetical protein GGR57DRAFT_495273 [Xylariaceae sp. FL1272]
MAPMPLPPKTSITSKEWVIPPRPKPGRKPATDTPPTKRKAQNRAAQRAFRERRAARVGELEEQLDEQRDEYERTQKQLQEDVSSLTAEVESLRLQCSAFEESLDHERSEKAKVIKELESLRRRWRHEQSSVSSRNGSFGTHDDRMPSFSSQPHHHRGSLVSNASGHRNSTGHFSVSHMISPPDSSTVSNHHLQVSAEAAGCGKCRSLDSCACIAEVIAATAPDCGGCSIGTRCACLEAALEPSSLNPEPELKRKPSSILAFAPEEKRQKADAYPNEIDFTAMFSSKTATVPEPVPSDSLPPPQSIVPRESCGFCTDGSYCMCAEATSAQTQTLAPMGGAQVQTPPPSDSDVGPHPMEVTSTGAIKLPSLRSLKRSSFRPARETSGGCGANGPGTCSQCLRDPKAGLFCRSLAATFAKESGKSGDGCCGGSGGPGCCQSKDTSVQARTGVGLSVADAYKTLSSHPGFDKASDEIETWLPKLRAVAHPSTGSAPSRTHIDVETASIMGVLKEFDVRFGSNK